MTFALTKVQAYGIESEEPLNKRYRQYLLLTGTAAATDTALDLGLYIAGSLGTFWTAAGTGTPGAGALTALQDIGTRAQFFDGFGADFQNRAQVDNAATGIVTILSAASSGGSTTENYTVTGLLTTDTILSVTPEVVGTGLLTKTIVLTGTIAGGSATPVATVTGLVAATDTVLAVSQKTANANSLPLLGYTTVADNAVTCVYSADPAGSGVVNVTVERTLAGEYPAPIAWNTQAADGLHVVYQANPGTGAKVQVTVSRAGAVTAVEAGTYQLVFNNKAPSVTFASGNAPTTFNIALKWVLQPGVGPVEYYAQS